MKFIQIILPVILICLLYLFVGPTDLDTGRMTTQYEVARNVVNGDGLVVNNNMISVMGSKMYDAFKPIDIATLEKKYHYIAKNKNFDKPNLDDVWDIQFY